MPGQDSFRIRPRLTLDCDAEDDVVVSEVVGRVGMESLRVLERRNAVDGHAAAPHLVEADDRLHSVREELLKTRINLAVQQPFEERIVRMRIVRLVPDPIVPAHEVGPKLLARPGLEEFDEPEELEHLWARWAHETRQIPDEPCIPDPPLRTNLAKRVLCQPAIRRCGPEEQLDVGVVVLPGRLHSGRVSRCTEDEQRTEQRQHDGLRHLSPARCHLPPP